VTFHLCLLLSLKYHSPHQDQLITDLPIQQASGLIPSRRLSVGAVSYVLTRRLVSPRTTPEQFVSTGSRSAHCQSTVTVTFTTVI
jgi:hypothetical protein